ncbi:MAG TPA: hypothetical protein VGL08_06015 [Paraburkholderia sp.]|jgi:hypothetical protein
MRALIERQLYHPAVVMPMLAFMQLMVSTDFNLGQAGLVVASNGARAALQRSRALVCHVRCPSEAQH